MYLPLLRTRVKLEKVSWRQIAGAELPLFVAFALVVFFSFRLTPSPQLYGTHRQLGLPACPSVLLFHHRCPTCGLTTSFAASAHAAWPLAFQAHPVGPILWLLTIAGTLIFGGLTVTRTRARFERAGAGLALVMWVTLLAIGTGLVREVYRFFA